MGLQSIMIALKALVNNSATRSERGIVCLILDDATVTGVHTYTKLKNVTESFTTENKAIITRCFSDRGVKTLKVACYNSSAAIPETIEVALTALDGVRFNYLANPYAAESDNTLIETFIKEQREANNILVKAVLYNHVADYEGIINFINNKITMTDEAIYTGTQFTVDVACLAATCSLTSSLTNLAISGIKSVDDVGIDLDVLVDAGKLFLFYDDDLEEVVFSRGVNSKTTIGANEKESLKKIRIIEILDMLRDDMKITFKKNYQGKVENSLANKKLLVTAYNTYLRGMVKKGVLSDSEISYTELDVDSTVTYLEEVKGYDDVTLSAMPDAEILNIGTDEHVFITGTVYALDTAEDLALNLNY